MARHIDRFPFHVARYRLLSTLTQSDGNVPEIAESDARLAYREAKRIGLLDTHVKPGRIDPPSLETLPPREETENRGTDASAE